MVLRSMAGHGGTSAVRCSWPSLMPLMPQPSAGSAGPLGGEAIGCAALVLTSYADLVLDLAAVPGEAEDLDAHPPQQPRDRDVLGGDGGGEPPDARVVRPGAQAGEQLGRDAASVPLVDD